SPSSTVRCRISGRGGRSSSGPARFSCSSSCHVGLPASSSAELTGWVASSGVAPAVLASLTLSIRSPLPRPATARRAHVSDNTSRVHQGDARTRILDAVDALAPRLVQTLSDAIRIPSINPRYPGQRYQDHIGRESEVS